MPAIGDGSFYVLRSSVYTQHTMQIYCASESTSELVFVANFTQT